MVGEVLRGMSNEDYHALPAFNAGGAHEIIRWCPEKYWYTSPFNPDAADKKTARHFDIGKAVHTYILEPEKFVSSIQVIDANDYRTKAAKEARNDAYAAGLTPILADEIEQVEGMAKSLLAHSVAGSFRNGGGDAEVTMLWKDPDYGMPCKLRLDFLPFDILDLHDVKSAARAHPDDFERSAWDMGYCQRAAWYIDGVELVTEKRPRWYWFYAVEKEPPYLVSANKYTEDAIEWGRVLNLEARRVFAQCMDSGVWPGYRRTGSDRDTAFDIGVPRYVLNRLQDMAEAGDISTPRSVAELDRMTVRHRLAARLGSPDPSRDYMPPTHGENQ